MPSSTKIEFRHRRIRELEDITDFVGILFPGNRNQQHAAARILLFLKTYAGPVRSLRSLEQQHGISRRTIERTRAKLARVGLIEHLGPLSKRANGQPGWRLSGRMSAALRLVAHKIEAWRSDARPERREKDELLVGMMLYSSRLAWWVCLHFSVA
jgi:hypothetical protein